MGKSQTFTIGNNFFTSKGALEFSIKEVLHNSGIEQLLVGEAFDFIYDAINRAPLASG